MGFQKHQMVRMCTSTHKDNFFIKVISTSADSRCRRTLYRVRTWALPVLVGNNTLG